MRRSFTVLSGLLVLVWLGSCKEEASEPKAASGVEKATVKVPTGSDGLTAEQRNIQKRLIEDNKPGSIKHLYVMSAYSGQVLIYSTVDGKVSSSGKRLTPTSVNDYFSVTIGDVRHSTGEVLQDDGSYGSSGDYLYWWDVQGNYHQHYVQGGQIVHVSSQPLAVKSVILNVEVTAKPGETPISGEPLKVTGVPVPQ